MDTQTVRHEYPEPRPELRLKVERNSRGYNWEIAASAPGHDVGSLLAVLEEADRKLRERFGPTEESGPRAA
jgi:hypothetical protein